MTCWSCGRVCSRGRLLDGAIKWASKAAEAAPEEQKSAYNEYVDYYRKQAKDSKKS